MGVDLVGIDFMGVDVETEHRYVDWESANTAKLIVSLFRVSLDHEADLTINEYPCQKYSLVLNNSNDCSYIYIEQFHCSVLFG